MECIIALLFTENARTVFFFIYSKSFIIKLGQSNCEWEQDKKKHAQKFSKILQHLPHWNLWNRFIYNFSKTCSYFDLYCLIQPLVNKKVYLHFQYLH